MMLSICLFFCCMKRIHKTRFSQKLSNLELWSLLTTSRKSSAFLRMTLGDSILFPVPQAATCCLFGLCPKANFAPYPTEKTSPVYMHVNFTPREIYAAGAYSWEAPINAPHLLFWNGVLWCIASNIFCPDIAGVVNLTPRSQARNWTNLLLDKPTGFGGK